MHEWGLMKALVRRVEQIAAAEHATEVTRVRVGIGALSHLTPEYLESHFAEAARDGVAAGAILDVVQDSDQSSADAQDVRLISVDVR